MGEIKDTTRNYGNQTTLYHFSCPCGYLINPPEERKRDLLMRIHKKKCSVKCDKYVVEHTSVKSHNNELITKTKKFVETTANQLL